MKRYNLVLPDDLYDYVERLATTRHESVATTLRKLIKMGLIVLGGDPDTRVYIQHDDDPPREVIVI